MTGWSVGCELPDGWAFPPGIVTVTVARLMEVQPGVYDVVYDVTVTPDPEPPDEPLVVEAPK